MSKANTRTAARAAKKLVKTRRAGTRRVLDGARHETRSTSRVKVEGVAAAGAIALATAAILTAGIIHSRRVTKLVSAATAGAYRLGRKVASDGQAAAVGTSLAVERWLDHTGLIRRRPFYVRALPGIGLIAGLVAIGSVAALLAPRLRAATKVGAEELRSDGLDTEHLGDPENALQRDAATHDSGDSK
jgi:hypothetical protein